MRGRVLPFSLFFSCFLPFLLAAQKPVVDFTSDITSGCTPLTVSFKDASANNPTSWRWDYGNGAIATTSQAQTVYSNPGTYTVKLVASNSSGTDSIIKVAYIQVKASALFKADFIPDVQVSCRLPVLVNFKNTSETVGTMSYSWRFGDGGTSTESNPSHIYKNYGTFSATLVSSSNGGCIDSVTKVVQIKSRSASADSLKLRAGGCLPFTYAPQLSFDPADPVTSYFWDFGNGYTSTDSKPSYTYTTVGVYKIRLVYTTRAGCTDSVVLKNGVSVGEKTEVDFDANPTITCGKQNVFFTSKAGLPVSYEWSFGDGFKSKEANPTHRYQDTGLYTVTLSVDNKGCKSVVTKKDIVYVGGTVARFDLSKDCNDRGRITFKNTSVNGSSYVWDFGDGTTSLEKDPEHVYTKQGDYPVRLVSIKDDACKDTQVVIVHIWFGKTNVTVDRNSLCKGESVVFSFLHPSPKAVDLIRWDFGDGSTSESTSDIVRYFYRNVGEHTIRVVNTDIYGCRDTVTKTNFIKVNGPAANFEADIYQGCKNTEVTFKDLSSTGGLNAISKWDWKFGDGTSQQFTQPPFKHVYASGGSFDVVLTVTDLSGCSASLTKKAFILIDGAEARFTSADTITCNGSEVVFKNQSTGSISGSLWHFGDGKTSTSFDAVHAYADTGVYPVKLVVTTSSGCMDSLTRKNYVTVKNPKAKFGYTDPSIACASFQINFYDSSYFAKSWLWEFGDGKTSTLKNPSHTYTAEGTYTIKLTITSSGGCLSTYSTDVKVAASRNNLVYSPLSGCKNNAVTFYTMSKGSSEFILDFGDGEVVTSRDSVILHIYKKSGRYLPKILFKEPASCSAPIFGKDTINIQGITANFISDTKAICERGEVKFKDSSVANTAMSYMWDFGDGTTSTVKNPLHTYAVAGTYDVKLVVTTLDGCTDSITKPAYIRVAKFPVAAIVSQSEACEQAPVTFSPQIASDTSTIIKWLWSFGNGQTSSSKNPPPQLFATAGNYTNTLTVVNSTGCSTEVSKSILLHPVPQILTNDTTICKGDNVQLLASGTTTYKWSPAPSLSCIDCSSPIASPVVDQTYKVNATSAFNCVNADSVRIKVLQPLNVAVTPPEGSACIGDTIQLRATGASMYLWAPSATLSANNISNPKAIPSNDITYTVIGYDSLGCFRDTAYAKIKVYQYPTVELGPDIVLAAGSTKVITPVFSGSITNYLWTPAKDLSCFTCPSPVLSARGNITYGLKVSNEGGCSAEDLLNVVVTCDNSAVFIPNTFSPNNDGMNDVFYPRGRGISTLSSLRVTNRWGEVVFNKKGLTANSPSDGWDGMYKGKRAEAGVYTYMVEVICSNSRVLKYIGNITLIQ